MKIAVNLTVEVDPDDWYLTYGSESVCQDVLRQDVREYVLYSVQGLSGIEETEARVSLR